MHISKVTSRQQKFPDLVREITSVPKHLFVLGELPTGPAIALVGSRKPTNYGREVTYISETCALDAG